MLELCAPAGRGPEVRWITGWLLGEVLGVPFTLAEGDGDAFVLRHGGRTLTVAGGFFGRLARAAPGTFPRPALPLERWDLSGEGIEGLVEPVLPVLFGAPGLRVDAAGDAHLALDVFGSAFFMLSRCEEVNAAERDGHDRFPASASVAGRADFLHRPLVDEYAAVLWAALQRTWPGLRRRAPAPRTLVSHDVDRPSRFAFSPLRTAAADLLKRRDPRTALQRVRSRLRSRRALEPGDPFNTFDWLMDVSERHGLRSAFYFICGRTDPAHDAEYDVGHAAIRALLRRIHARGHEIGLHPSYNACAAPERIVAEAARLRRVCAGEGVRQDAWGGRMHYLRWRTPDTLHGWEAAGMDYDSTLGYADRPGFRCGTCREYPAFDPVRRTALRLRIRPLVAMECTVMAPRYMGLGVSPAAFDAFSRLRDACRTVGGDFTLLWHNSEFGSAAARELYEAVVA
jgi:hypothetical protein